jgi:hypothetical protein
VISKSDAALAHAVRFPASCCAIPKGLLPESRRSNHPPMTKGLRPGALALCTLTVYPILSTMWLASRFTKQLQRNARQVIDVTLQT